VLCFSWVDRTGLSRHRGHWDQSLQASARRGQRRQCQRPRPRKASINLRAPRRVSAYVGDSGAVWSGQRQSLLCAASAGVLWGGQLHTTVTGGWLNGAAPSAWRAAAAPRLGDSLRRPRRGRGTTPLSPCCAGSGEPPKHSRKLPGKIVGLSNSRVHPETTCRNILVGRISRQEHATPAVIVCNDEMRCPGAHIEKLDVEIES